MASLVGAEPRAWPQPLKGVFSSCTLKISYDSVCCWVVSDGFDGEGTILQLKSSEPDFPIGPIKSADRPQARRSNCRTDVRRRTLQKAGVAPTPGKPSDGLYRSRSFPHQETVPDSQSPSNTRCLGKCKELFMGSEMLRNKISPTAFLPTVDHRRKTARWKLSLDAKPGT